MNRAAPSCPPDKRRSTLRFWVLLRAFWATGVLGAPAASSADSAPAPWPGPAAVTATYESAKYPDLYQGDGGEIKSVQGIEIWEVGRPTRPNRELGVVHVVVAAVSPSQPAQLTDREFFDLVEGMVATAALKVGGGVVVLRDILKDNTGAMHFKYRVSVYSTESGVPGDPVLHDATTKDADGNSVPNGVGTAIHTTWVPDIGPNHLIAGDALANICVGVDGSVTEATIIKSSGHAELDTIALRAARTSRYSPSTVRGRPVASCKYMRYTWKPLSQ
jgi:TonB family protein